LGDNIHKIIRYTKIVIELREALEINIYLQK